MATRTPQLPATDPWDAEPSEITGFEGEEDETTLNDLMVRASRELPNTVRNPMDIAGEDVDASDVFTDDEWASVPQLPKGRLQEMADTLTPFKILHVMLRQSKHGHVFILIIDVAGQVFSAVVGADEEYRKRKLAQVAYLLANGARSVGPFRFELRDTDKGNAYVSIVAVPKGQRGKKSSLVDVRGK